MVNIKLLFVLFFTTILFGCSDTETTTADSEITGTNGILSVTLTNSEDASANIISLGSSAIIKVKLTNAEKVVINNHAIDFSTNKGVSSSDARLTGSDGTTEFVVDTTGISTGIVTATVSTTVDSEVLQTNLLFEVVDATTVIEQENFSISLSIVDSAGIVSNRIGEQNSAQLQATLTDDNNAPIVDIPVFFTAELGSLQAPSALTNNEGIATVSLTTDSTLGAGFASAQAEINTVTHSDSLAYEVIAGVNVESVNLGHFDDSNAFILDQIKTNVAVDYASTINAGATLGIEFSIVDDAHELITDPITATFTSTCVANGKATIDNAVASIKGTFKATYKDISCAGAGGNVDTIIATITVNSKDYIVSHDITLSPEGLGSIEFISASPESIVIKGTGGQGQQEISTLTFLVRGELGNPFEQQEVTFELTSEVGGIKLVDSSGQTNSEGLVSVIVRSGTVPTAVRVNATVTLGDDDVTISTQSDLLSINTGLPDQDSFTLAFSETNPEARNIVGKQVIVSAYLADSFNNPIPDGTTINFTTEGGSIESHCNTFNGKCSVLWTSQEPFLDNHRATILAYAIGHETFFDVNGNNIMDDDDGTAANSAIGNMDAVDSGFQRADTVLSSGFIDMQDAWRDDNENNVYDSGEIFFDYANNGSHDAGDGFFNGPQCSSATLCPASANKLIHIRRAGVLITSSSYASLMITQLSDDAILGQNYGSPTISSAAAIARNGFASYLLAVSDSAMQTLPVGTQIGISTNAGELSGTTQLSIADTVGTNDPDGYGGAYMTFTLKNNVEEADVAEILVSVIAPSGRTTQMSFTVALD